MIKRLLKYRILLITFILIFCVIFVESPFHGNYYVTPPIEIYFIVTAINLLIYLIPTDKLIVAEKFVYSFVLSLLMLIVGGLSLEVILGYIYGYDEFYYELKTSGLLTSILFYLVTNFGGIGILAIWLKYKNPIYK